MEENADLISREQIGRAFGKLGGDATFKKYGKSHFKELSKKGVEARKNKKSGVV